MADENMENQVADKQNDFNYRWYIFKCFLLLSFLGILGQFTYMQFFVSPPLFDFPGIKPLNVTKKNINTLNEQNEDQRNTFSANIYYVSSDLHALERVDRNLAFCSSAVENARTVILELLKQPHEPGLTTVFDKNINIRTTFIHNDILYIDFDRSIMKSINTSALREDFMIKTILSSLKDSVLEIKKVKFLVNGKSMPTFFKFDGHADISGVFETGRI